MSTHPRLGNAGGHHIKKIALIPRIWYVVTLSTFLLGQLPSKNFADTAYAVHVDNLPYGNQVKSSGEKLISQPGGFTRIQSDSDYNDTVLLISVHGYKSEGYEWVAPLVKLANSFQHTFFYRYDWNICPEAAAEQLAAAISGLVGRSPGIEKMVLFGHSYGGIVVTFSASRLHVNIPVEIHVIASPLAGYTRLFKNCEISRNPDGTVKYPSWADNITHLQWRTQHKLDNAFRRFREDPQEVILLKSRVFRLPDTMDGHRLGHNWSVTWVINEFLGNPHRP